MADNGPTPWPPLGIRHGPKRDIERLGQFAEMSYLHGTLWQPPIRFVDCRDGTLKQMIPPGPKIKTGLQDAYFDEQFKRLFVGEGINWRPPPENKFPRLETTFYQHSPWFPPKVPIRMRYRGDCWGTISGIYPAFSPRVKPDEEEKWNPRGIYTQPGKKGGPGYRDITINPYPEYKPCKYEPKDKGGDAAGENEQAQYMAALVRSVYPGYFDDNPYFVEVPIQPYVKIKHKPWALGTTWKPTSPAKRDGGCKMGTIGAFPEWVPEKYIEARHQVKEMEKIKQERDEARGKKKKKPKKTDKIKPIIPPSSNKKMQVRSVWKAKLDSTVNEKTWATLQPQTFKKRFLIAK